MKFPCTLKNALLIIRDRFGLSFSSKDWATFLHFYYYYRYLLVSSCYQTTLLLTISELADITLLKTTFHLLLARFDTLTYWKDYDWSPILVGHQGSFLAPLPGSEALLVRGIGKEKFILCAEIYCHLLLWKTILWGVCSRYLHLDRNHN